MAAPASTDTAKSTTWQESIPVDEADRFAGYVRLMARYQAGFARRGDGRPRRGFHVKSHAGLRARFEVLDEIPAAAKHGVFREARVFPAWVRLTNGFSDARPDWFPDLLGFAVKLFDVDGPKLLDGEEQADTQDFLALNQPSVPAADAGQLGIMSMSAANVLTAPLRLVQGLGFATALRIMAWTLCWMPHRLRLNSAVTEDYHSLSPITVGPHAVKLMWRARQRPATSRRGISWRNFFREDLRQRLREGTIRYDLFAQFYVDAERTPIDGASAWKPADAPFVKLAELTIAACDLESDEARSTEVFLNGVSFSPWHAIAEHRPIGNIQRARRVIYEESARMRGRQDDPA